MARTKQEPTRTPTAVVNCLKSGDPDRLQGLVNSLGTTEFLKAENSIKIRDMDCPVVAYFCNKENAACVRKALELEPQANLKRALDEAIVGGSLECVRLILQAHKSQGHTPMDVAGMQIVGGLREIIYAGQRGIDILKEVCEHETVGLGSMCMDGSTVVQDRFINMTVVDSAYFGDCVDYLCQRWKQDPNNGLPETECDKPRPIHRAAMRKRADCIEKLLANGAHVHAQTVNGTPVAGKAIHVLCANTEMEPPEMLRSLRALVSNGADPQAPSIMQKRTPLAIALKYKVPTAVDYLVVEARVPYQNESTEFGSDAAAKQLLGRAVNLLTAGVEVVTVEDEHSKRARTQPSNEMPGYSGNGKIVSDEFRQIDETHEITCQDDASQDAGLRVKSELLSRCLEGERLGSDGDYPWRPFWCSPDPSKRPSRRTNGLAQIQNALGYALGSDTTGLRSLKVTMLGIRQAQTLCAHLGWDSESLESGSEEEIDLNSLSLADAAKLDRSDRIELLKGAMGANGFCATFKDAVVFPVFIGTLDESSGCLYGCFATRVDT